MTAKPESRAQLPPGLSPVEEARWWDEHRDYWDTVQTAEERVAPALVRATKPVNLRLPVEMIEGLKRAAERRALPYQTLIRMWLKERLDADARERGG
jgi:predicted DNA binding CopG/RHH family protein